jgi:hypothetical protein
MRPNSSLIRKRSNESSPRRASQAMRHFVVFGPLGAGATACGDDPSKIPPFFRASGAFWLSGYNEPPAI